MHRWGCWGDRDGRMVRRLFVGVMVVVIGVGSEENADGVVVNASDVGVKARRSNEAVATV